MNKALFQTKAVKLQTLAEYLVQIRTQLNLDLKTVSLLTQIKPDYLEKMETGNWQLLPAEVYVKGFLKQLATCYNLPAHTLVEQFEKEQIFEPPKQILKSTPRLAVHFTPKILILASSLLLTLLAVIYLGSQIRSVMAAPFLEIQEPAADLTVKGNSVIVAGSTEAGAEVSINHQTVLVDRDGEFTENLVLGAGLNVIEIRAVNKFGRVSKITRNIQVEEAVGQSAALGSPVVVTVEIGPESAWIYLEADGIVVQRGTMLPGSHKTVSAQQEVLLTSANAGSTGVVFNEKELGLLGRAGEVVRNVAFSATTIE